MKVLYLSYDGMTDPLGGSQVLPYLKGLSQRGHRIWLISCEKAGRDVRAWDRVRRLCAEVGISWHPLRYHKRPPVMSTVWDVLAMRRLASKLQRQVGFDLVHCRSYVPALVGMKMKRRYGTRFLFDMRGFWPEEKLEGGGWDRNPLLRAAYRYFKRRERDYFREADAIVSLTIAARDQMMARLDGEGPPAVPQVIPCCVDMGHFRLPTDKERIEARAELGIAPEVPVLCYLGSLGGYYMLEEMLLYFAAMRKRSPGARFLFITREPAEPVRRAAAKYGIGVDELVIQAADRDQVPRLLAAADLGISFIWPTFSKTACCPTKLGEMMGMGLPVVVNAGVGDVDRVIEETRGGIVVDKFDDESMVAAVDRLDRLSIAPEQIRAGAQRWFALDEGVAAYDAIYRSLGRPGTAG